MKKPAAKVGSLHTCPMVDGTKPHVGGPVLPGGQHSVIINGSPAATLGDSAQCIGPTDKIVQGSNSVLIAGKPAARQGDSTSHLSLIHI